MNTQSVGTSEYRGTPPSNRPTNVHTSYSGAAQSEFFPTKEQAILLDGIYGVPIKEYAKAIATLVPSTAIRFISRISNNRICVFLSTKNVADDLTTKFKNIQVNGTMLKMRPLISQNKRIIISNVPPIIPHSYLEDILKNMNVQLSSQISFLRAGLNEEGFSHILSFRRQVYINLEDVQKIPDSIQINFDNTNYWIYLSLDTLTCFLCKKEGHQAKACPDHSQENVVSITNPQPDIASSQIQDSTVLELNNSELNTESLPTPPLPSVPPLSSTFPIKRPYPESSSVSVNNSDINNDNSMEFQDKNMDFKKPKPKSKTNLKKLKNSHSVQQISNEEALEPIKKIMLTNPNEYDFNFLQLKCFIDNTYGKSNIGDLISTFTSDRNYLANKLRALYPFLTSRSMKNRFSRIIKQISSDIYDHGIESNSSLTEASEDETSSSQQ